MVQASRVLLVLSDLQSGLALRGVLSHLGCEVSSVTSLTEMRARLPRHHPDLIIIDDALPGAAALLPELQRAAAAPVLILAQSGEAVRSTTGAPASHEEREILAGRSEVLWSILDNIPVMVAVYDADGRLLFINRTLERTAGWSADEARRMDFLAALFPDQEGRRAAWEFLQRGTPGWRDFPVTTRSGASIETAWANVRLSSGFHVAIGLDVRARKAAEKRLMELNEELDQALLRWRDAYQEAERRRGDFERLAENSPDVVSRFDRYYRHLYVNRAVESATGRSREQFIDKSDRELGMPEANVAFWERHLQEAFESGEVQRYEFGFANPDGGESVYEGFLVPEYGPDGTVETVLSISRDVTEHKRIEASLRESELRFRQLAENIAEVFWLTDWPENRVIYVSPAFESIWGIPTGEVYADPMAWADAIVPEDRQRIEEAFLRGVAAGDFDINFRIIRPDGQQRWIHDRGFAVYDENGEVYRVAGVAQDRTEERVAEEELRGTNQRLADALADLKRAQERVVETEKTAALGMLAAGVANELSNPLMGAMGYLSYVRSHPAQPDTVEMLERAERELLRLNDVIKRILGFAQPVDEPAQEVRLTELLTRTLKALRPQFAREAIEFELDIEPDLPPARAKTAHLEQVFGHLLRNAVDAVAASEVRRIGVRAWRCGEGLCVEVADSGSGIPESVRQRVFDPFFTTKPTGDGAGLGLAISRNIIEDLGGSLTFDSEEGKGTRFLVRLRANGAR